MIDQHRHIRDIDQILKQWPFDADTFKARVVQAADGRQVLQLRLELGLLQMEVENRPDGITCDDHPTYLDYLQTIAEDEPDLVLEDDHCLEIDQELAQYDYRRACWLSLGEYVKAMRDADHSLAVLDFIADYSEPNAWRAGHEQHRDRLSFQRLQAEVMWRVEENQAEQALELVREEIARIDTTSSPDELPTDRSNALPDLIALQRWLQQQMSGPHPTLKSRPPASETA